MKLNRININVGAAVTSNVKEAEAAVEENIGKIVGELLSRLQTETKGDPFELRDRTNAMLESIRTGNGIGLNTAAPAPATAPVLGAPGSSPTSEEERLGTILLHDILGGDQTAANGALDMLRKMAASKQTAIFAGHVIDGLAADTFTKVDPNVVGDFVIALVRDVAAGTDEFLPSGMGYELKSVKEQRRVNGALSSNLDTLLNDLGVSTVANATTKIQSLKDEETTRINLERLLSNRSGLNPATGEAPLAFVGRVIGAFETQVADARTNATEVAATTILETIGRTVNLTRATGEDNAAFQARIVKHLGALHAAHVRLVNLAVNNGVLKGDDSDYTLSDNPNDLIEALVAFQAGRVGSIGGPRLHA